MASPGTTTLSSPATAAMTSPGAAAMASANGSQRSSLPRSVANVRQLHPLKYGQSAPTNLLRCLQQDQACVGRPLLYRTQYVANGVDTASYMHTTDVCGHHGCVNAVSFSNLGEDFLVTGGDDERVLVWKVRDVMRGECHPAIMDGRHQSNVFSAIFSCNNSSIFSGGNDGDVIQHDFATGHYVNTFEHRDAVYCVAAHPSSPHIILTASEDGAVHIIDTRLPARLTEDMVLAEDLFAYQSVAINPVEPRLVAVSSTRHGTLLFDTRERRQILQYKCTRWGTSRDDCVSVCFNSTGTQLFTLQRQLPPCVFDIWSSEAKYSFVDDTGVYRNSVTMKSGCFMGQRDEYVVSGSDDFRLYIWKIPEEQPSRVGPQDSATEALPHLVLPGHRSIVNQVRYSRTHHLLCSSGVEKVVKLWSHLPLPPSGEIQHSGASPSRRMYSRIDFLRMSMHEDSLGPADPQQEDPTVLAFFDALVDQDGRERSSSSCLSTSSSSETSNLVDSDSDSSLSLFSDSAVATSHHHVEWVHLPFFESDDFGWRSDTPSSLSPANTSSLEPPWSDSDWERREEEVEDESSSSESESSSDEEWSRGDAVSDDERHTARAACGLRQTRRGGAMKKKSSQNGQQDSNKKDQDRCKVVGEDPSEKPRPKSKVVVRSPIQAALQDSGGRAAATRGRNRGDVPQQKPRRKKQHLRTYCREDFLKPKPAKRFYSSNSTQASNITAGPSSRPNSDSTNAAEDRSLCCSNSTQASDITAGPSSRPNADSSEDRSLCCSNSTQASKITAEPSSRPNSDVAEDRSLCCSRGNRTGGAVECNGGDDKSMADESNSEEGNGDRRPGCSGHGDRRPGCSGHAGARNHTVQNRANNQSGSSSDM